MAVGLSKPENILLVPGLELAATACGIKSDGRDDLVLIKINENANVSYRDKEKRKKALLYYIHPKNAAKEKIKQPKEYQKIKATVEDLMEYFDDELYGGDNSKKDTEQSGSP